MPLPRHFRVAMPFHADATLYLPLPLMPIFCHAAAAIFAADAFAFIFHMLDFDFFAAAAVSRSAFMMPLALTPCFRRATRYVIVEGAAMLRRVYAPTYADESFR